MPLITMVHRERDQHSTTLVQKPVYMKMNIGQHVDELKKKMKEANSVWVNDLQQILWSYQMTPRHATSETPFTLTYGFEAQVLVEVLQPTWRALEYEEKSNEEEPLNMRGGTLPKGGWPSINARSRDIMTLG